jgi:hypothetical protein
VALEKRPRLDSWQGPRRAGAVVPFFRADTIERNPLIEILLDEHDRIDWALKKFRRQMPLQGHEAEALLREAERSPESQGKGCGTPAAQGPQARGSSG